MLELVPHFIQFDPNSTAAMAKSIKLFQPLEKVYQSLGIQMSQPKLKNRASVRCYIYSTVLIICLVASMEFFVSEGKSVGERGDAFYMIICFLSNLLYIITYIGEAPKIRQLVGKFEMFFEESKSLIIHCVHCKKLSEILNFSNRVG